MTSLKIRLYNALNDVNPYLYINTSGYIYKLIDYSGLESSDYETEMITSGASDGGYLGKSVMPPRRITLTFTVDYISNNAAAREHVMNFFTPRNKCTMQVTRGSTYRYIDYYAETGPEIIRPDATNPKIRFTVRLICPYPYFTRSGMTIAITTGGAANFTSDNRLPIPFSVDINPTGAPIVNPVFSYAGYTITTNETVSDGKQMLIYVKPGEKYIMNNNVYTYNYSIDSEFELPTIYGSTTFYLSASSGLSTANAYLRYYPSYMGA
jgi:hypothetical protein